MSDINLDTTQTAAVVIKTRNEDGSTSEHHFEAVPLTKQRLDAIAAVRRSFSVLRERAAAGAATGEDELAAAGSLAAVLDQRVRSTNGPVTITSLWEEGRIGFEHMRRLSTRLDEETAASPPA